MSDSNNTLPDIYKFSSDIVRCPTVVFSLDESKSVAYLFPQKFCGHRWLENGKALKRVVQLHSYFKRYFSYLKEEKKIPPKNDRFTTILDKMGFPLHLATLEFSLFICNEIEPFLTFFQAER